MSLYLSPTLTPAEIRTAAASGVVKGVKSYPRGVTTNSDGGVENYEVYYPVFGEMEKLGLVLNLHGEVPSDADKVGLLLLTLSIRLSGGMYEEREGLTDCRFNSASFNSDLSSSGYLRPKRRSSVPCPTVQASHGFP